MTKIDTSRASREFDAWIAENVKGWHKVTMGELSMWCVYRTRESCPTCSDDWIKRFPEEAVGWWADEEPPAALLERQNSIAGLGHKGLWQPTRDIAAAWTVDRPKWMWRFAEAPHGLQVTLYPTRELYDARPYDFEIIPDGIVTVVTPWDMGSKAAVYALGRCQAAYAALSGGEK